MLSSKIKEANKVIRKALELSGNIPLIVNFSGGKDSSVVLDLVQKQTDSFVCMFAKSSLDFDETIEALEKTAKDRGIELYYSNPSDYKGDFYTILKIRKQFPTINYRWCQRDLKFYPMAYKLRKIFGGNYRFFKILGVRQFESKRRKYMYRKVKFPYIIKDWQKKKDRLVFPILHWTNEERDRYIEKYNLKIETNLLYEKFGISGCFWCVFYGKEIYLKVLNDKPNIYNRIIEFEKKLQIPSVKGNIYLSDLKEIMGSIQ